MSVAAFLSDPATTATVAEVALQYDKAPAIFEGNAGEALEYLRDSTIPDIIIIDLADAPQPPEGLTGLRETIGSAPWVIALGEANDIGLYRRLINMGISDYLVKPVTGELLHDAIRRADNDRTALGGGDEEKRRRIAVLGVRGGVGASTIATSLAWIFAEQQRRKTALVDFDLEFGTIALSLDIEPTAGLREALEKPERIDSLFIASATARISDRLSVLAAEETLESDRIFSPQSVDLLLDVLNQENEIVIADIPRSAVTMRRRLLETASHIMLVTDLGLPALRDCLRLLNTLQESDAQAQITIVANRTGSKNDGMSRAEFEKALGRPLDMALAEDPKASRKASDTGKPIPACAKSSKFAQTLSEYASRIAVKEEKASGGGLLQKLLGGRKN